MKLGQHILVILLVAILLFILQPPPKSAQAANCGGLPVTTGALAAGTYTLTDKCTITGTLIISGTVTINGDGYAISGNNSFRIFTVNAGGNLTLNDIVIRNANGAGSGGAIYNQGTLTLNDVLAMQNNATSAGGFLRNDGTTTITNSEFIANTAFSNGGAIQNFTSGTLTISGSRFYSNSTTSVASSGGAIENQRTLTVTDSTFLLNLATSDGGAIYNQGSYLTATITDSIFISNTANVNGGAIYSNGNTNNGTTTIQGSDFQENTGDSGGAVVALNTTLTISDSRFIGNRATVAVTGNGGGAIYDFSPSTSTITITNTQFSANSATGEGGAIRAANILNITDSTFSSNSGGVQGGAIHTLGVTTITRVAFVSNSANIGGGIYAPATTSVLNITESFFQGNTATSSNGGGIYLNDGNGTITNTTFTGNTAISGAGSAIFARDTTNPFGTVSLVHVTVSGNGVFALSQSNQMILRLQNSLVSGNISNCNSTLTDDGGNLINTSAGGTCVGITPLVNADPLLGTFSGEHFPLQTGSPAIDAAPNCGGLTVDQRGVTRPQGSACDIGAFEVEVFPPAPLILNTASDCQSYTLRYMTDLAPNAIGIPATYEVRVYRVQGESSQLLTTTTVASVGVGEVYEVEIPLDRAYDSGSAFAVEMGTDAGILSLPTVVCNP